MCQSVAHTHQSTSTALVSKSRPSFAAISCIRLAIAPYILKFGGGCYKDFGLLLPMTTVNVLSSNIRIHIILFKPKKNHTALYFIIMLFSDTGCCNAVVWWYSVLQQTPHTFCGLWNRRSRQVCVRVFILGDWRSLQMQIMGLEVILMIFVSSANL